MNTKLDISIVMSAYNAKNYIKETIDSVLNQSYPYFEFLIVDDGSTDDTFSIVSSYSDSRICSFKIENSGVAYAKNYLIKKAKYNWIAIIDADDTWDVDKLKKQVNFLNENPDYVLLGTYANIMDKEGSFLYIEPKISQWNILKEKIKVKNQFTHSSVIYRKDLALECGLYYEKVKQYIVDYKLLHCLCKKGKAYNLPEPLVNYRIVPGSLSTKNDSPEFKRIMDETINRGYITDEDLSILKEIKDKERNSPKIKLSNYHYYLGRVFLFYNFNRAKAFDNFYMCLRLNLYNKKAFFYIVLSVLPKVIIIYFYKKYFGDSENFNPLKL